MNFKQPIIRFLTFFLVFLIIITGIACRTLMGIPATIPSPQVPASSTLTPTTKPPATRQLLPSLTAEPSPTSPPSAAGEAATLVVPLEVDPASIQVRFHPDDKLVVGDKVSIEVIPPPRLDFDNYKVQVSMRGGEHIGEAAFTPFGIGGRLQATLTWVWDTRGLDPGEYPLKFTINPGGISWEETVSLLPADTLPAQLREATWAQADSNCCVVNYFTGTAAERDLDVFLDEIDLQAQDVVDRFGIEFSEPVTITLLSRLLGHGGFASSEIQVSYLDRDYSAGSAEMVIHHEMVHILDSRLESDFRPSLFVEGLAVYLTGGHFKQEPLMARAAALLDSWGTPPQPGLGWYIPLVQLADDFYDTQHEIGYLEAAALVEYMVDTYGWEEFMDFYHTIEPDPESQAAAIDTALRSHLNLSLADLEQAFLDALQQFPADPVAEVDVRLTVQFYDTVRRYQQRLDPSAYFLTAWLVDTTAMRKAGIVADYLRHPDQPINLALETMLADAGEDIHLGEYRAAESTISAVNAVLQAEEEGWLNPFAASLAAADYLQVVQLLVDNPDWFGVGPETRIEPQRIWIEGTSATAWLTLEDADLLVARLEHDNQGSWQFAGFNSLPSVPRSGNSKNPNPRTGWDFIVKNVFADLIWGQGMQ